VKPEKGGTMKKNILAWLSGLCFMLTINGLIAKTPIDIQSVPAAPIIDGNITDPEWQTSQQFSDFFSFKPNFGNPASEKTLVRITYDQKNIYVSFKCFDSHPNAIMASICKRDGMFGEDWVGICLDTFNDHQSGYTFICNPLGIQGDGIIHKDGNLDASMDMVWHSKGKIENDGYAIEMQIPLKILRFPQKKQIEMGIWLVRRIVRTSEQVCLPAISPNNGAILTQTQPIIISGIHYQRQIELLPALTYQDSSVHREGRLQGSLAQKDISLTAKYGLNSQLTLDAAINPDFSQVEADAGQIDINLRHAIFYQEKRPFFMEGQEMFSLAGNSDDAPLMSIIHTRNILAPLLGLKLSGKLNQKTSVIGLFSLDRPYGLNTITNNETSQSSQYAGFGIARFKYNLKDDSYLGGFYTSREYSPKFNRVIGSDGHFRINGKSFAEYHILGSAGRTPENSDTEWGHALGLRYNYASEKWDMDVGIQDISEQFRIDSGFLTRSGLSRLGVFVMRTFTPKSSFFQRIEPFYWSSHVIDKPSRLFETLNVFCLRVWLPRESQARFQIHLGNEVFAGQRFNVNGLRCQFNTFFTRKFNTYLTYYYGNAILYDAENPYGGRSHQLQTGFEFQPAEKLNESFSIILARFINPATTENVYDYAILRNRLTWQFNSYLFLRAITEYNTYHKQLSVDLLTSFTYIPGTVFHLGYGSIFEKKTWLNDEYIDSHHFLTTQQGLFIKISYLLRI
jgi:hypothetical protein